MDLLSDRAGVDNTVYESYDNGDAGNADHITGGNRGEPWHRRISSELWLWLIVVGAIAGLWLIAGSFRKVLG